MWFNVYQYHMYSWFSYRILLRKASLPVTWGDRKVVNGGRRIGSSHSHHFRHHHKKSAKKVTEGIVIEIGTWTEGTPERGIWSGGTGTGMNAPRDQIVATVGLPGTPEHPGILPGMTS
jgi:hypothetical protein